MSVQLQRQGKQRYVPSGTIVETDAQRSSIKHMSVVSGNRFQVAPDLGIMGVVWLAAQGPVNPYYIVLS